MAEADTVPGAGRPTITLPGLGGVAASAYDGGSGWLGWNMVRGRWYRGPGEVDANTAFLTETGLKVGGTVSLTVNGRLVKARIAGQVYLPDGVDLYTSWQTFGGAAAGLATTWYDVGLRPGTSPEAYARALSRALGPNFAVTPPHGGAPGFGPVDTSYIHLLTLMMAVLAGLGVLNSVLMVTRERTHDLGVFKAIGKTPRQAIAMVVCWAAVPAIGAAVIALPAGMILQDVIVHAIGGIA